MPLPRRLSVALYALSAGALLAGCTDSSAPTLTAAQLIEQGNAICAAGNERMEAAWQAESPDEMPSGAAAESVYDTVVVEVQGMVDGLRALQPPAELEADYTAMLAEADTAMTTLREAGAENFFAMEEDPFAKANEIAIRIGLNVCGESE
jgi:hypothetical protein